MSLIAEGAKNYFAIEGEGVGIGKTSYITNNCLNGNHSDCTSSSCSCSHHQVSPQRDFSGACAEGDHSACKMTHSGGYPPADWDECLCPSHGVLGSRKTGTFTRKHYVAIAGILSAHGANPQMVEAFADFFAGDNPLFDRQRFLDAAGRT